MTENLLLVNGRKDLTYPKKIRNSLNEDVNLTFDSILFKHQAWYGGSHTVITENAEHRILYEVKFLTLCNVRYTIHRKFTSNTHLHAILRPHFYFQH